MLAKCITVALLMTLATGQRRRPNILLLVTDDQDIMLGSMDVMNHTRECITENGVEFANAFTTTPICCPSRSSILTGLYPHNHHVYTNNDNCSSLLWRRFYESKSFATYLNQSGYHTGYFGKYLNEYDGSYTPAGWHYWMGLVKNSKYYNYTLLHNGAKELHGSDYEKDYLTDLVTNRSIDFFREAKQQDRERPVLSVVSFPAPHGPEDGAPQYQNLYQGTCSHETQSFDYVPNPDKHWIIRQNTEKMDGDQLYFSTILQQKRLQTLRSVDDNVKKIVGMLQDMQELENTYIMYFSDHGYHIGQFGLPKGKSMPYDFDIRIPFLMRGPGLPRNEKLKKIALNIDIAPTILGMAGVPIPVEMDGRNLLDLFDAESLSTQPWRDSFLVQRGKMPRNKTHLVRPRMKTKLERLQKLCASPNYANPCQRDQYWTCVMGSDKKLRLQKCKKEKKPAKQKTRPSQGQRRRQKLCPCPANQGLLNSASAGSDEINVLETCNRRLQPSGHRNRGSRRSSRLSKRNLYNKQAKEYEKRAMGSYNKLRKEKDKRRRYKRNAEPNPTTTPARRRGSSERSMVLTSSCRLYMPNFEIRCLEDLYNDPNVWVRHMGYLARSVKTLQLKMKYMKTLRSCLNAYDEMIKSQSQMCECPPNAPKPKVPKPAAEPKDNVSHPLLDLNVEEDREYQEQKRIFDQRREQYLMIKETRQAKLQRQAQRQKKGRVRVKSICSKKGVMCFLLSNQTWDTEPKWNGDRHCYCTNSNNNTYWCIRIINEHTNVLYCQFITGFREYYDLNEDPYQLVSRELDLPEEQRNVYQDMIGDLRRCKGSSNCTLPHFTRPSSPTSASQLDFTTERNSADLDVVDDTPQGRSLLIDVPHDPVGSVPSRIPNMVEDEDEDIDEDVDDILDTLDPPRTPRKEQRESSRQSPGKQAKGMRSRKRKRPSKQTEVVQGRRKVRQGQAERPRKKQTQQETSPQNASQIFEDQNSQHGSTSQRSGNSRHRMGRVRPSKTQKNSRSKKKRKNSFQ